MRHHRSSLGKCAFLAVVAHSFFLFSCSLAISPAATESEPVAEAVPIELDRDNPAPTSLGAVTFLSGYQLVARDARFGGISGIAVSADGTTLHAISDRGYWFSATLQHDTQGRLLGLGGWTMGVLLTPEGSPVSGRLTDAEAITRDRDGSFIVSFEQIHRLWRYPPPPHAFSSPARAVPAPADLKAMPANGGLEAITVLPDGRLLAIAEEHENPDKSVNGWLLDKDRFESLAYMPADGFRATDMASLSNGDLLVVERRFSFDRGFAARIVRISGATLRPGSLLRGEELGRFDPPLAVDNYEGLAVWESKEAGTLLYLISDDNYSLFQRTLLLQFRLENSGGNR